MKDIYFYLEYETKAKKNKGTRKEPGDHTGNVAAVYHKTGHFIGQNYLYDGISATFFRPDSDVSFGSISPNFLRERCKRISESLARKIHPRLFAYLDD